jgi:hypothetical protein
VAAPSRDTLSFDLLGLEPPPELQSLVAHSGVDVGRNAKITRVTGWHLTSPRKMAAQARAAGLSHGVYVATLIAGAPAVLTSPNHRRAVATLTASKDRVALMATDVNGQFACCGEGRCHGPERLMQP